MNLDDFKILWIYENEDEDTIPHEVARQMHKKQWHEGKHAGESESNYNWPYSKLNDGEPFKRTKVHVNDIVFTQQDHDPEKVKKYQHILKTQGTMGDVWGKHSPYTPHKNKVEVSDGNHRVKAAMANGETHVSVLMPHSHYQRWVSRSK